MGIFDQALPGMRAFSEDAMPDGVLFNVRTLTGDGKGGGSRNVLTTRGPFKARVRPIGGGTEQNLADQLEIRADLVLTVPREVEVNYPEDGTYTYADGRSFVFDVAGPMPRSSYGPHRKAFIRIRRDDA